MTLSEYAAAMERSRRPGDAAVARYIRQNEAKLRGWIEDGLPRRGGGRGNVKAQMREELTQVALLAVVEVVRGTGDAEAALRSIGNAIQNQANRDAAWCARRSNIKEEN